MFAFEIFTVGTDLSEPNWREFFYQLHDDWHENLPDTVRRNLLLSFEREEAVNDGTDLLAFEEDGARFEIFNISWCLSMGHGGVVGLRWECSGFEQYNTIMHVYCQGN